MGKKLTQEEFLHKCNETHNYKFNYSLVEYTDQTSVIIIKCPIHGEFTQKAHLHLHGAGGCIQCNGGVSMTPEHFILRCNEIHNYKYDYSLTVYTNIGAKIIIKCPEHDEFTQNTDRKSV